MESRLSAADSKRAADPLVIALACTGDANEGLSHPEIVALTGLPLGTVKSHIARGAARLRETLVAYAGR